MTPGVAARFPQAGLATPHYLASGAGAAELARGGNAIDAIVAANLALGVVAPYLCGYGGDLFAIVWDGELHGYLGSGRSPARANLETVSERLGDEPLLVGPHSVTVPGAIAGWFDLLERWGTRPFAELARDAIRYARDGFELTPMGAISCTGFRGVYRGLDDWQAVYGTLEAGDVLRQPALARLIELLAEEGPSGYYKGVVADAIATALQRGGGLMDAADLAAHVGEWATPMRARYRDFELAELPPPTQGVAVLEIMRILDGFDLGALEPADRATSSSKRSRSGCATATTTSPIRPTPRSHRKHSSPTNGSTRAARRSTRLAPTGRNPGIRNGEGPPTCARRTATGCS